MSVSTPYVGILCAAYRQELLALARASIESALPHGNRAPCPQASYATALLELRSSFVTLRVDGELRGCCGTLDAPRPLNEDVWRNAWAAAFADPRFTKLSVEEWPRHELHISVLGRPEPLALDGEGDLLAQLQPFVDGLIFELGATRVTFLPAVWELIPDAASFVRQLKLKAGWRADFWSSQIQVWRYEVEGFGEPAPLRQ
jgi:uncharacterized protein